VSTTPGSGEVRFPAFDVLRQATTWDDVTASVVLGRMSSSVAVRFFSAEQEPTARALFDRLLGQDDEPRIAVLEMIDQRLFERRGDGYRYEDMPEDWDAFSASVDGLDADARLSTGRPFSDVEADGQMQLIDDVRTCAGEWHEMPAKRVFSLWTRYACDAFYSHPWAWNEIGFGGPAYPRGYKNLGIDRREPWEVAERQPHDPVPWSQRAEGARRAHEAAMADRRQ
jgi:hypothetical protein